MYHLFQVLQIQANPQLYIMQGILSPVLSYGGKQLVKNKLYYSTLENVSDFVDNFMVI